MRHPKDVHKVMSSDLRTTDIDGAQASTSTQHVTKLQTRDMYMKTKDVPGAQIGTLKKGIETGRQLDPLWPIYTIPGHSEPGPVLSRNWNPDPATSKYGFGLNSTKVGLKSDLAASSGQWQKSPELAGNVADAVQNKNDIQPTDAKDRRSSGSKTPLSQVSQGERKITSPLMRTGEEIIGADKNKAFGDYVPARISKENVENSENSKPKSTTNLNLETKVYKYTNN